MTTFSEKLANIEMHMGHTLGLTTDTISDMMILWSGMSRCFRPNIKKHLTIYLFYVIV